MGAIRLKEVLEGVVALHPLSRHPSDIGRLDEFTCALSRYMRKRLDQPGSQPDL
jgi:hypothetical protein